MFKKTQLDTPTYRPTYDCVSCGKQYFSYVAAFNCASLNHREKKEMIENQKHNQKIELLDRALEYSKSNQISLAEAQKEINDFLNPPTCLWALHLDNEHYPCSLPENHRGPHESGKMLKFEMKFEER